ncbi:MAG TPA: T9SS type A sorting domain-containing protein [Saprospiraceae bacterium]|nr:T9SS type A sorting domain-containing protein [Saprospiraceae bacterium]
MKLSALLLCLFVACISNAQNLLDENNLWMDVHNTINFGTYYKFFQLQNDTTIASNTYKKLYSKYDEPTSMWEFICGIREDSSGKVYFVRRASEEERLLYDFNLKLNDSFFICNNSYIYVNAIDTITLLNGESRKRIQFDPGPETWIEGIGSLDGIEADGGTYYCITTGEDFPFLNCFSKNGEVLFKDEWHSYPCLDGTTALQNLSTKSFNLYPNPTKGIVQVSPDDAVLKSIRVYSSTGVFQTEFFNTHTIDLGNLNSGVYFLELTVDNHQRIVTKITKEN